MKPPNYSIVLIIYTLILFASIVMLFSMSEYFLSNDFLENIFYVFYFHIALAFILIFVIKKPVKTLFIILFITYLVCLALYGIGYIYLTALASSFSGP